MEIVNACKKFNFENSSKHDWTSKTAHCMQNDHSLNFASKIWSIFQFCTIDFLFLYLSHLLFIHATNVFIRAFPDCWIFFELNFNGGLMKSQQTRFNCWFGTRWISRTIKFLLLFCDEEIYDFMLLIEFKYFLKVKFLLLKFCKGQRK